MKKPSRLTISRRTFRARMNRLNRMQERNWQKHFAEHPEQLLPGADVERRVPLEEAVLLARIIGPDVSDQ